MAPTKLYIIIITVFTTVIGYDIINWLRYRSFSKVEAKNRRIKSTVNFSVLIIAITLTLVSVAFHINFFNYGQPIEYARIESITLRDFKGYKLPNQTLNGTSEFAFIRTSISWEKIGNEVEIKSLFHPSRSYTFNENFGDKFLIQHELYHFRITEYCAREIRKEISKFKNMPSNKDIKDILANYLTLEDEMQNEYDNDTYHSYVLKEQKRWQKKVDSLLILRQQFADIKIVFTK
jgi:hypothetical protein